MVSQAGNGATPIGKATDLSRHQFGVQKLRNRLAIEAVQVCNPMFGAHNKCS